MLKRRVEAIEKRLAGLGGPTEKKLRVVEVHDGDPEPQAGPDEELLVVRFVNTRGEDKAKKEGRSNA